MGDHAHARFAGQALVLIGDPKQAIYAFRGGDVYAYLEAAGTRERASSRRNFRADQPLIDAYDALFGEASSVTRTSPTCRSPRSTARRG